MDMADYYWPFDVPAGLPWPVLAFEGGAGAKERSSSSGTQRLHRWQERLRAPSRLRRAALSDGPVAVFQRAGDGDVARTEGHTQRDPVSSDIGR